MKMKSYSNQISKNKAQLNKLCFLSVEQSVFDTITEHNMIKPKDTVVLGLSGGPDSVGLLLMLSKFRQILDIDLHAVHINHMIRGAAADADELFCRELCDKHEIRFTSIHKDIPAIAAKSGETLEECGRRIRYEEFEKVRNTYDNAVIATAHHLDDQAETVLFRMIRGTGIKGLGGMDYARDGIIRPLLDCSKKEITEYLNELDQSYRIDDTNMDDLYSRNMIRNHIIKDMEEIVTGASSHIAYLAKKARQAEEFIESSACAAYKECVDENGCDVTKLSSYDDIIVERIIRRMIESLGCSLKDVSHVHIESIMNLLDKTESSQINLPRGIVAKIEGGRLYILLNKSDEKESFTSVEIVSSGEYQIGDKIVAKVDIFDNNIVLPIDGICYTKWLSYDKMNSGLCIRTRREGDYLIVKEDNSRKKLSDYMINEKIPKGERDKILLLASGSMVYWVIGYRIGENVKVTQDTKKVFKIEIIKEK